MSYYSGSTDNFKSMIDAALCYAEHGFRVIPCYPRSKRPAILDWTHQGTTDAEQIKKWWEANPNYNIGRLTGKDNRGVVFDCDDPSLLAHYGAMPETPCVFTSLREDGQQKRQYWLLPPDFEVSSVAKFKDKNGNKIDGFDSRGEGGQVLVPPSVHPSGAIYKWHIPLLSVPLAPAPAWLLDILPRKQEEPNMAGKGQKASSMAGNAPQEPSQAQERPNEPCKWGIVSLPDDFTSHPGAKEGSRNETYKALVSVHLLRGDSQDNTLRAALAWAERCSPPYDDVPGKIASSFKNWEPKASARQEQAPETYNALDEPLRLPSPDPYPDLPADAFYGLAGELVRFVEPETEASPVAILLSFLTMFGSAIGRNPFIVAEQTKHHANLFCVIAGTTADAKGSSLAQAKAVCPADDWRSKCFVSGLSSGQGLIERVADGEYKPIKEGGAITGFEQRQGVQDKRLMVIEQEFSRVIAMMGQKDNILSAVLREAWDTGDLSVMNRGDNALRATDAHISIIAHITPAELSARLSKVDCANGFANRFLWAKCKRSKLLPDGGALLNFLPHHERLSKVIATASQIEQVQRDAEARAYWHDIYPSLADAKPGIYGGVVSRARAQMLRLQMLYALLDGFAVITLSHIKAAHALWQFCDDSARLLFGDVHPFLAMQALGFLKATPGMNKRELHKAFNGHLSARQLDEALTYLVQHRLAYSKPDATTGGRPCERWYPVEPKTLRKAEITLDCISEAEPGSEEPDCDSRDGGGPQSTARDESNAKDGMSQEALFALFVRSHAEPSPVIAEQRREEGTRDETIREQRELREQRVKEVVRPIPPPTCNTSADASAEPNPMRANEQSPSPASAPGKQSVAPGSSHPDSAILAPISPPAKRTKKTKAKDIGVMGLLSACNANGVVIRQDRWTDGGLFLAAEKGCAVVTDDMRHTLQMHQQELYRTLYAAPASPA